MSQGIDFPVPIPVVGKALKATGTLSGDCTLNLHHDQNRHIPGRGAALKMSPEDQSNCIITGEACIVVGADFANVQGCVQIPVRTEFRLNYDTNCYEMNFGIDPVVLVAKANLLGIEKEYPYELTSGTITDWIVLYCF